jgi:simple sugar transport system substrate-binding protein
MRGTSGSAPAKEREAGFLELMRRQMNIQIISDQVFGGDSPESARSKSEEFRKQILEASGIFCSTPEATLGVVQALRGWGVPGKKRVVAIGSRAELLEALRTKELQFLVVPDAKRMGEEALRMLENHWEGNPVPAHREVPAEVLRPSNFGATGDRSPVEGGR